MISNDNQPVEICIEYCRANARLPEYAHPGDAGMDLRAAEEVLIAPGQTLAVPTGIRVAIPSGYEIQVRPRSGLSLHTPLRVPNSPGTIDSGFRDEVHVILHNCGQPAAGSADESVITLDSKGNRAGTYRIRIGDRIAQMVLARVETASWRPVESVKDEGDNRGGGFGHTGIQ